MAKLFYNQDLMKYVTTFIYKDPRKRYPDQEEKRQKVLQTLNQDLEEYPSRMFCWNCDEPCYMDIAEGKRFYIKGDSGLMDTCLECSVRLENPNIHAIGYVYARWGI